MTNLAKSSRTKPCGPAGDTKGPKFYSRQQGATTFGQQHEAQQRWKADRAQVYRLETGAGTQGARFTVTVRYSPDSTQGGQGHWHCENC